MEVWIQFSSESERILCGNDTVTSSLEVIVFTDAMVLVRELPRHSSLQLLRYFTSVSFYLTVLQRRIGPNDTIGFRFIIKAKRLPKTRLI